MTRFEVGGTGYRTYVLNFPIEDVELTNELPAPGALELTPPRYHPTSRTITPFTTELPVTVTGAHPAPETQRAHPDTIWYRPPPALAPR